MKSLNDTYTDFRNGVEKITEDPIANALSKQLCFDAMMPESVKLDNPDYRQGFVDAALLLGTTLNVMAAVSPLIQDMVQKSPGSALEVALKAILCTHHNKTHKNNVEVVFI